MKFWNKKKKSRARWAHVSVEKNNRDLDDLKVWCQSHPSIGKFYCKCVTHVELVSRKNSNNLVREWQAYDLWFEDPGDAVAFKLIHG